MTTITVHMESLIENMAYGATEEDENYLRENIDAVKRELRDKAEECGVEIEIVDDHGGAMHRSYTLDGIGGDEYEEFESAQRDLGAFEHATGDLWSAI